MSMFESITSFGSWLTGTPQRAEHIADTKRETVPDGSSASGVSQHSATQNAKEDEPAGSPKSTPKRLSAKNVTCISAKPTSSTELEEREGQSKECQTILGNLDNALALFSMDILSVKLRCEINTILCLAGKTDRLINVFIFGPSNILAVALKNSGRRYTVEQKSCVQKDVTNFFADLKGKTDGLAKMRKELESCYWSLRDKGENASKVTIEKIPDALERIDAVVSVLNRSTPIMESLRDTLATYPVEKTLVEEEKITLQPLPAWLSGKKNAF